MMQTSLVLHSGTSNIQNYLFEHLVIHVDSLLNINCMVPVEDHLASENSCSAQDERVNVRKLIS